MTKHEYLAELLHRLQVLPESEIADAISYYEEYLNDAGDDEEGAMERLGTPSEVASKIISDYTEGSPKELNEPEKPVKKSNGKIVWTVILIILASPMLITVAAVAISLLAAAFSVIVTFGATGISFLVGGLVYIPLSLWVFTQNIGMATAMLGSSFVLIGVGFALLKASAVITRLSFKGINLLFKKFFSRNSFRHSDGAEIVKGGALQ